MYAIIKDGGRQYKVEEGQQIDLDYREVSSGEQVTLDTVLAVSDDKGLTLGTPTVAGATVSAEVVGVEQGKKIYIQKFRRRKTYRRRTGHRQLYTRVRVQKINAG